MNLLVRANSSDNSCENKPERRFSRTILAGINPKWTFYVHILARPKRWAGSTSTNQSDSSWRRAWRASSTALASVDSWSQSSAAEIQTFQCINLNVNGSFIQAGWNTCLCGAVWNYIIFEFVQQPQVLRAMSSFVYRTRILMTLTLFRGRNIVLYYWILGTKDPNIGTTVQVLRH